MYSLMRKQSFVQSCLLSVELKNSNTVKMIFCNPVKITRLNTIKHANNGQFKSMGFTVNRKYPLFMGKIFSYLCIKGQKSSPKYRFQMLGNVRI